MEKKSSVVNAFKENERITFVHIEGNQEDVETEILVDRRRLHHMVNERLMLSSKFLDFAEYRFLKEFWKIIKDPEEPEEIKQLCFIHIDNIKRVMGLY